LHRAATARYPRVARGALQHSGIPARATLGYVMQPLRGSGACWPIDFRYTAAMRNNTRSV
jgi:hypothetical protein